MRRMQADIVDLVVVGYGGAGAACSLTAADLDAQVVVVEKQPENMHTPSTRMSAGVMMGVTDVERATTYLDRCAGGLIPREVTRAWARGAYELFDWLTASGVEVAYRGVGHPEHLTMPGADAVDVRRSGTNLWDALVSAVTRRPSIAIRWGSPASRLLTDETGRVVGVEHGRGADRVRTFARRGVVLCCGGFEFDERMKAEFLDVRPAHFYGNPGNTGDGVRMAQQVGADLWHMNAFVTRGVAHFELDGEPMNFAVRLRPGGYVITDSYGRRFTDESSQAVLHHDFWNEFRNYDSGLRSYSRIPAYWIFDHRRLSHGPLTTRTLRLVGVGSYEWSESNEVEVKRGWIASGSTVGEAAERAGVSDPDRAAVEVMDYNRGCAEGVDRFGRPTDSLVALDRPPYYCVSLYPGGSNTSGGPRRDARARILDPFGKPIANLFGAGELGQAIGALYPADGYNLSEALTFGRIAACSALSGALTGSAT